MNKDNARDYLPLVQALADGKQIQGFMAIIGKWGDIHDVCFNAPADQYRIKPEPKEIWVNRYPNGSESYGFDSELKAHRSRANDTAIQVCYREVIE